MERTELHSCGFWELVFTPSAVLPSLPVTFTTTSKSKGKLLLTRQTKLWYSRVLCHLPIHTHTGIPRSRDLSQHKLSRVTQSQKDWGPSTQRVQSSSRKILGLTRKMGDFKGGLWDHSCIPKRSSSDLFIDGLISQRTKL